MFFILSKTLGYLVLPSNLALGAGLVGVLLLFTRFARAGRRLMVGALLALAVIGYSPLGNLLMAPLENRFPAWDDTRGAPDGIVVLGGAINPDVTVARGRPALNEAAERLTAVATLARRYPQARIVFTGGSGQLTEPDSSEAQASRALLESFGIAAARITLETQARNTVENARLTKDLVRPAPGARWLLVTSAGHMPRAIGVFRRQGFAVEAYPVDWRTGGPMDLSMPFESLAAGAARTDAAAREWIGLLVYWVTGRTSALFPAPDDAGR